MNRSEYWNCRFRVESLLTLPALAFGVELATETALAWAAVGAPVASKNGTAPGVKPVPTKPVVLPPLGLLYCVWLNRLKESIRNCILTRSVMLKNFDTDKSALATPGPRQSPIGAVPIVPNLKPFNVYRLGLTHWNPLLKLAALQGCPATRFGRYEPFPSPMPESSFRLPKPPSARTLLDRIENHEDWIPEITIEPEFVVRDSTTWAPAESFVVRDGDASLAVPSIVAQQKSG